MRVLENETIRLRVAEKTDLDYLLNLRWDKRICETIVHAPISREQQLAWWENLKNSLIFIIETPDNIPVGIIGYSDFDGTHRRAKWNLRIHPDHWRKGIGRTAIKLFLGYCFNTLNINKLMGDCFEDNIAEVNNLSKLGFRKEGVWVEHYFHKGKFRNSIQFVMLKSEYQIYEQTKAFHEGTCNLPG